MTPLLLILGASLFGVANLFSSGVYAYMLGAGGCMLINLGLNNLLWRANYRYVAYKFFAVWFVFQPMFFFLCLAIFPSYFEEEIEPLFPVSGKIYCLFISFCIVPLMAVMWARFMDSISGSSRQEIYNFAGQRIQAAREFFRLPKLGLEFEAMLVVSAMIITSVWITTLSETNVVYFFFRVLGRGMTFAPFVAGLYWNRNRLVQIVWIVTLLANLGLAFMTGSRSYGFLPLGYYGLGFILQQSTRTRRLTWLAAGMAGLIFMLMASGVVNVLRSEVGRTDIKTMNVGDIMSNLPDALSKSLDNNVNDWDAGHQNAFWSGLNRMVDATLLAAPNMTPEVVPYRGYGTIKDELGAMASIPGLGIFPDLAYDSKMLAADYGFGVSEDYDAVTQTHSSATVPFNIVADSWSRGGIFSVVVQVGLALLTLTFVEKLCYRFLMTRSTGLFVLGRMAACGIAFYDLCTGILTDAIRQLVLTLGFTVICVGLLMTLVGMFIGGSSEPARPPPPGPMDRRPPPPRPRPIGPRAPRPYGA